MNVGFSGQCGYPKVLNILIFSNPFFQQSIHKTVQTKFKVSVLNLGRLRESCLETLPLAVVKVKLIFFFSFNTGLRLRSRTHDLTILNTRGRKQGGKTKFWFIALTIIINSSNFPFGSITKSYRYVMIFCRKAT